MGLVDAKIRFHVFCALRNVQTQNCFFFQVSHLGSNRKPFNVGFVVSRSILIMIIPPKYPAYLSVIDGYPG